MIYTKTGDKGTTSLVGGTRVAKCDVRVEAYGTVDELNAAMGLLAEMIRTNCPGQYAFIKQVQRHLFVIQTLLATEHEVDFPLPQLKTDAVEELEQAIDALQAELPPLRSFVIPGGNMAAAQCNMARTVCRRAERRMVSLSQQLDEAATAKGVGRIDAMLQYINRLSDYLFVLSRHLVVAQGDKESFWRVES